MQLWKGHGTGNDFVLILDRDGTRDVSPQEVAALTHRRFGIGGDGLIRVVPSSAMHVPGVNPDVAPWFMDYRNADGSVAEWCGNGVRVFAEFLFEQGLMDRVPGVVGTRAGEKAIAPGQHPSWWTVHMGAPHFPGGDEAQAAGHDVTVTVAGTSYVGLQVDMGNPHVVVAVPSASELGELDLSRAPSVSGYDDGYVNVEFLAVDHPADGDVRRSAHMRVFERGVGETLACGTGATAAVSAATVWAGEVAPAQWHVVQPGGAVEFQRVSDGWTLSGPAVIVAELTVRLGSDQSVKAP